MSHPLDAAFSRSYLRRVRKEAELLGIKIPKGLRAANWRNKSAGGEGWWYLSDKSGTVRKEIWAHNSYDAKAKFISKLIP